MPNQLKIAKGLTEASAQMVQHVSISTDVMNVANSDMEPIFVESANLTTEPVHQLLLMT